MLLWAGDAGDSGELVAVDLLVIVFFNKLRSTRDSFNYAVIYDRTTYVSICLRPAFVKHQLPLPKDRASVVYQMV